MPLRCAGFYGCPCSFLRLPLRFVCDLCEVPVHERIFLAALGVYGVRWRLSRFFRLLLECLCGASLQFLRAASEQLLQVLSRTTCCKRATQLPTNT